MRIGRPGELVQLSSWVQCLATAHTHTQRHGGTHWEGRDRFWGSLASQPHLTASPKIQRETYSNRKKSGLVAWETSRVDLWPDLGVDQYSVRTETAVSFQGQPGCLRKGKEVLLRLVLFSVLTTLLSIHKEKAVCCQCFMGSNWKFSNVVMCVFNAQF